MSARGSARTGRSSHPATGRTTLRGKQDKQHRLKGFLIQKVRERNAIDGQDPNTLRILNEEADRMLCQPASEAELRKAEVRILNRLRGTPAPPASGRSSNCHTNRSAISHASDALGAYYDRSNPGSQRSSQASSRMGSSRAPSSRRSAMGDPLQNQDYWLKFTQMDVDNYQTEERRRAEEAMRVKKANSKYLDAQVNLKNRAQEASKLADKQWKQEVTKDYNRWQEENIVLEVSLQPSSRALSPVTPRLSVAHWLAIYLYVRCLALSALHHECEPRGSAKQIRELDAKRGVEDKRRPFSITAGWSSFQYQESHSSYGD